jgi:hypothetical protein
MGVSTLFPLQPCKHTSLWWLCCAAPCLPSCTAQTLPAPLHLHLRGHAAVHTPALPAQPITKMKMQTKSQHTSHTVRARSHRHTHPHTLPLTPRVSKEVCVGEAWLSWWALIHHGSGQPAHAPERRGSCTCCHTRPPLYRRARGQQRAVRPVRGGDRICDRGERLVFDTNLIFYNTGREVWRLFCDGILYQRCREGKDQHDGSRPRGRTATLVFICFN